MRIMAAVWPVTAPYFGLVAVAAYRAWGRPMTARWQRENGDPPPTPGYAVTPTGVSHCGAGCTLGDIIAEFAVFGLGATVAGLTLGAEYIGDYLAAIVLGIVFQYFAIAPMRGLSLRKGLIEAAKADVASLTGSSGRASRRPCDDRISGVPERRAAAGQCAAKGDPFP
jgi:Domain of unknown function (DUF4396)